MYGVMPPMPTNPYEVLQQQHMNSILNAPAMYGTGLVSSGTMLPPFLPRLTTPLNTRNTNFPLNTSKCYNLHYYYCYNVDELYLYLIHTLPIKIIAHSMIFSVSLKVFKIHVVHFNVTIHTIFFCKGSRTSINESNSQMYTCCGQMCF